MSKEYRFYVHSVCNVYVTEDYETAYSRVCELATSDEFMFFYDSIKDICIYHIDELIAYYENMQI